MARRAAAARRPGVRRRGVAGDARVHPRAARHRRRAPGEQVADFEEYTRLYRESWSDPDIRWLLSTVPTTMIFDDHDVHDDWNISWQLGRGDAPGSTWWDARITGAFMSYWIYQHLGNLSPPELDAETTLPRVRGRRATPARCCGSSRGSGTASRRRAAGRSTATSATRACSCSTRARPACSPTVAAQMIDEDEWDWIVEHSVGEFDHLVIASTLPVFLPTGIHHLAVVERGAVRGPLGRSRCEPERTAAPRGRPRALGGLQPIVRAAVRLVADARARHRGGPAARLDPAARRRRAPELGQRSRAPAGSRCRVHQLVCSPYRNPLSPKERRIVAITGSRFGGRIFGALARLAGVPAPSASWRPLRDRDLRELPGRAVSRRPRRDRDAAAKPAGG